MSTSTITVSLWSVVSLWICIAVGWITQIIWWRIAVRWRTLARRWEGTALRWERLYRTGKSEPVVDDERSGRN